MEGPLGFSCAAAEGGTVSGGAGEKRSHQLSKSMKEIPFLVNFASEGPELSNWASRELSSAKVTWRVGGLGNREESYYGPWQVTVRGPFSFALYLCLCPLFVGGPPARWGRGKKLGERNLIRIIGTVRRRSYRAESLRPSKSSPFLSFSS